MEPTARDVAVLSASTKWCAMTESCFIQFISNIVINVGMWGSDGFCFGIRLVVLVEFFFEFGSVGELLAVAFIHFFPNISKLVPEVMLEIVSVDIESFVVVYEILQFQQIFNVFYLFLYRQLFFFYSGL